MAAICPDFKWLGFKISDLIRNPTSFLPFQIKTSLDFRSPHRHCIAIAKAQPYENWTIWNPAFKSLDSQCTYITEYYYHFAYSNIAQYLKMVETLIVTRFECDPIWKSKLSSFSPSPRWRSWDHPSRKREDFPRRWNGLSWRSRCDLSGRDSSQNVGQSWVGPSSDGCMCLCIQSIAWKKIQ